MMYGLPVYVWDDFCKWHIVIWKQWRFIAFRWAIAVVFPGGLIGIVSVWPLRIATERAIE